MWCDNCLLLFPLRGGAIVLNVIMAAYAVGGAYFLFIYGPYLFFDYPEWYIYGAIASMEAGLAAICVIALTTQSYMLTRLTFFLFPALIILSSIRGGVMIFQLNAKQANINWECDNSYAEWPASAEKGYYESGISMPTHICSLGFHWTYVIFALCLLGDIVLQLYDFFLMWRFKTSIELAYCRISDNQIKNGYYA